MDRGTKLRKAIIRRIAKVHIGMSAFLMAWILTALILSFCCPSPALSMPAVDTYATAEGDSLISARVEVELDIFSGNPNPEESFVRIQNGTVQLSQNDTDIFYSDQDRHLERWLLNSGEPTLKSDLFKLVETIASCSAR